MNDEHMSVIATIRRASSYYDASIPTSLFQAREASVPRRRNGRPRRTTPIDDYQPPSEPVPPAMVDTPDIAQVDEPPLVTDEVVEVVEMTEIEEGTGG